MEKLISAIIIAKNEEKMLSECLKTLGWVDELLLLDTGSSDNTIKIAKKFGAKVVEYNKGKSFSDWRNFAAKKATGNWILYVDADERITNNLEKEISQKIKGDGYSCYAIPRRNFVLGKELRHGGFWPDYQVRLFKKSELKKWVGDLHERPEYQGELGYTNEPMIHDKHETISEMVEKTNKWSNIEGKLMFDAGHPPMNIIRFTTAMTREFWNRMIRQRAFLDGKVGVIFAIYQVFSRFVSYAKLWELQLKEK